MIYHNYNNSNIFFIRADAEEKYGKALIKLAEGAKGKDEIGYGFISNWWSKMRSTDIMLLLIHSPYIIH